MFTILITDKNLGGTSAHGMFRSLTKAQEIAKMMTDPCSVYYYGTEDEYQILAAAINTIED